MNTTAAHAITDLVTVAYHGARAVQTGFRAPTDDWQPMLFFTTADGRRHITAVAHADHQKEETAEAVTALLTQHCAVEALWLASAWEVTPDATDTDPAAIRPSRDPRRREILFLVHVGQDFAAAHRAPIRRHRTGAPTLGALTESPWHIDGLMSTALRRGIG
ncbi:hypothetical protein [Mycobacterium sp. NPDC006124]|uniref:hypothetical protein n=1 Tax=Mycobacterium sp. NPDC006124 TaxID=3156729 RepID=UPI0033B91042